MQNFPRQGALPPYNPCRGASPLDPCENLAHRLPFPQFKMEWRPCYDSIFHFLVISPVRKVGEGRKKCAPSHFWWQSLEMSHSGEFEIGGSMESLVEMIQIENSLRNYVNFTHKLPGAPPPGLWCHDGISDENSTIWWFSTKFYPWSYPLKQIFLGF